MLVGVIVMNSWNMSNGNVFDRSSNPFVTNCLAKLRPIHHFEPAVMMERIDLVMIFFQISGLAGFLVKYCTHRVSSLGKAVVMLTLMGLGS